MLLDWEKFDHAKALTTMQEVGIDNIQHVSITELLHLLDLGSHGELEERFPEEPSRGERVDATGLVQYLIQQGIVSDVIGALRLRRGNRVYFPTLVSPAIREYLATYAYVANRMQEIGLVFTLWLDDRLSVINNEWDREVIHESLNVYRNYFIAEVPTCGVWVSSETSHGIPDGFAPDLSKVTGSDLISILPYRRRYPWSTRVLDVVHFAWMCYLAKKCPGMHLAGASNKRTYQIFRQIGGKDLNVLLFKLGSEKALPQNSNRVGP